MRFFCHLLGVLFVFSFFQGFADETNLASNNHDDFRVWSKRNGETFSAKFLSKTENSVSLNKETGENVAVNIDDLSDENQKYVKELTLVLGMVFCHFDSLENSDSLKKTLRSKTKTSIPFPVLFAVAEVVPELNAEKAGIEKGMAFSLIDGKGFRSNKELREYLKNKKESSIEMILFSFENDEIKPKTIKINRTWKTETEIKQLYEKRIEKERNDSFSNASESYHSSGGSVQIKGYYRKDGTYVRPHTRSAPSKK